jgi:glutamyl-tRNA synthetase
MRRGLTLDALKKFIHSQGGSRSVAFIEPEALWTLNKQNIDPIVPRFTAVRKNKIVLLTLDNVENQVVVKKNPKHAKNSSLGTVDTSYYNKVYLDYVDAIEIEENEEITLR